MCTAVSSAPAGFPVFWPGQGQGLCEYTWVLTGGFKRQQKPTAWPSNRHLSETGQVNASQPSASHLWNKMTVFKWRWKKRVKVHASSPTHLPLQSACNCKPTSTSVTLFYFKTAKYFDLSVWWKESVYWNKKPHSSCPSLKGGLRA